MNRCLKVFLPCLLSLPFVSFSAPPAFSQEQLQVIDQRVGQYLAKNPEAIIVALKAYQHKMMAERQKKAQENLSKYKKELQLSNQSPALGNPKGSIIINEFMDYRCGHCKTMGPVLEQLIASNKDVKVIVKELPIFGAPSTLAAKIALAAAKQGKFQATHQALIKAPAKSLDSEANILKAIASVALDQAKLKQDLKDPAISKQLADNQQLARKININATPMFVLSYHNRQQLIPGAIPLEKLKKTIEKMTSTQQRAHKKRRHILPKEHKKHKA